jgi:hypothetical protein
MADRRNERDRQESAKSEAERRLCGDRRDSHRIPITVEVKEGNEAFESHQGNISIGGMFFEKPLSISTGATIQLRFNLPGKDEAIVVHAEVVEITSGGPKERLGTRVRFTDLDTRSEILIARFLDQHPCR